MSTPAPNHPLHMERQSAIDQPIAMGVGLILMIVLGLVAPGWLVAIVGGAYLVFLWSLMLVTTVEIDHVEIRFRPFLRRRIGRSEIADVTIETYRPLREWGGWGVRMRGADRAYTMSGDRGIRLTMAGGGEILIGSTCPELLYDALNRMRAA